MSDDGDEGYLIDVSPEALLGSALAEQSVPPAAEEKRRQAMSSAILSGVLSAIGIFGLFFFLKSVRSNSVLLDILTIVVQVSFCVPVAIGFWVYSRNLSIGMPLLWLRRFRASDRGKYRFQHLLKGATRGLFSPITIQDQSYRSSYLPGILHPLVTPAIALLGIFGLLPVALLLVSVGATAAQFAAAAAIWGMLTAIIGYFVVRRLGYSLFTGNGGIRSAAARLLRARQGRLGLSSQSIDVWKCSNANWQAIVRMGVEAADIVLMDLSNINDNIRWEIQQVRDLKKPAGIVWVAENGSRIDRDLMLGICKDYHVQPGDADALAKKGGLFVYPSHPLRYGVPRHYINQSKGLRALLLSRLPALANQAHDLEALRSAAHGAGLARARRIAGAIVVIALLGSGIIWWARQGSPIARQPAAKAPSPQSDTNFQNAFPPANLPPLEESSLLPMDPSALTQFLVGRWRYVTDPTSFGEYELAPGGSLLFSEQSSLSRPRQHLGRWRINPLGSNRFELICDIEGQTYVNLLRALNSEMLLHEKSNTKWSRR